MTGWDPCLVSMFAIGCDGGTNAISGVVPSVTRKLYDAAMAGRNEEARRIQFLVCRLFDVLLYSATMDDADTFNAPWTVAFPFDRESDYLQFEFACHEGNYAVPGALSGARALEARAVAR